MRPSDLDSTIDTSRRPNGTPPPLHSDQCAPSGLRVRRAAKERKQRPYSYLRMIGTAILESAEGKLRLADIYRYIVDNFSDVRNRSRCWQNAVRHNLSLHGCFVKAGRSANGKGQCWAIHPANVDDFKMGLFNSRTARLKVDRYARDTASPAALPPLPPPPPSPLERYYSSPAVATASLQLAEMWPRPPHFYWQPAPRTPSPPPAVPATDQRRRKFDIASLLATDDDNGPTSTTHRDDYRVSGLLQRHLQAAYQMHAFLLSWSLERLISVDQVDQMPTVEDTIKTEPVD